MASNPLAINLTPLVAAASAAASLASLALVIPMTDDPSMTVGYQPLNALDSDGDVTPGLPLPTALLFHYEGENNVSLESDITDHFVEDNSSVVDQIGLKPEIVTVTGFIGELNDVLPKPLKILQTIANNLLLVNSYQPQLSITALNALNQATLIYDSAISIKNSAVSAWSSITGETGEELSSGTGVFQAGAVQSKQQLMFQQFYGYWTNRVLFNVQTPWAVFTKMAIKNVRAVQDAETRMITSFEVTFKKIRVASTTVEGLTSLAVGRAATQAAVLTTLGTSSGIPGISLGAGLS